MHIVYDEIRQMICNIPECKQNLCGKHQAKGDLLELFQYYLESSWLQYFLIFYCKQISYQWIFWIIVLFLKLFIIKENYLFLNLEIVKINKDKRGKNAKLCLFFQKPTIHWMTHFGKKRTVQLVSLIKNLRIYKPFVSWNAQAQKQNTVTIIPVNSILSYFLEPLIPNIAVDIVSPPSRFTSNFLPDGGPNQIIL